MIDVSFIILTYNEERHIERCLKSIRGLTDQVFVVDSCSTDQTQKVATSMGAQVFEHRWPGRHSDQFNWGLDNLPIRTKWVFRLDADEYLTEELCAELEARVPRLNERYTGIVFPLRRIFMGYHIRHGTGTVRLLRMFQYGRARSEARWMDEHIQVESGELIEFEHEFADDNLQDIGWWTRKHDGYAIREAVDLLDIELGLFEKDGTVSLSDEAQAKRRLKERYVKKPLFLRAFVYFFYRYFFRLGFIEGVEGFLWNFLQGWWYRTLVDAKIYEIKKACGNDVEKIREHLRVKYCLNV